MNPSLFRNVTYKLFIYKLYIYIYIDKQDLALKSQQGLICYKTQPIINISGTCHLFGSLFLYFLLVEYHVC